MTALLQPQQATVEPGLVDQLGLLDRDEVVVFGMNDQARHVELITRDIQCSRAHADIFFDLANERRTGFWR
ncbi:hypothetical protein D3C84_1000250 [compost metagenome]